MRGKAVRGVSLATVLVLVTVLATLATAMMTLFLTHLNLYQSANNSELALREAEAGLTEVIARINSNPDIGVTTYPVYHATVTPGLTDKQAYHQVSFDTSVKPYSTNNPITSGHAAGINPVGYKGRALPPDTVLVISEGFCQGQFRTVEALVLHPKFPYAVASDGDLISASPLLVTGADLDNALDPPPLDRPGNVASNGKISLTGKVTITGAARAVGSISIPNGSVAGGAFPNSSPLALPFISTHAYDSPEGVTPTALTQNLYFPPQEISGFATSSHDIVFYGPVQLDACLIRTSNNITFMQGISGSGGVVADGNITVQNISPNAATSDRFALISQGTLQVLNAGTFRGLLYSQTSTNISSTIVLGTALANGDPANPVKASIHLEGVTATSQPQLLTPYVIVKMVDTWDPFLGGFIPQWKHFTITPTGTWKFNLDTFVTAADGYRVGYCKVWNQKL